MEKKHKIVSFEGDQLVLKDELFRCSDRGLVVMNTQKRDYTIWIFDTSVKEKTFFLQNQRWALEELRNISQVPRLMGQVQLDDKTVALITDPIDGEDLVIKCNESEMIDHEIFSLGISLARVLMPIHEAQRVANITNPFWIFTDRFSAFKFANFSLCFDKEQTEISSPEILQSKLFSCNREVQDTGFTDNINKEDDIYCLGLCLYHQCYGNTKIKRNSESKIVFPDEPKRCFPLKSAIDRCMSLRKYNRMTLQELIQLFEVEQKLDVEEGANNGSNDSTIMVNIDLSNLAKKEKTPKPDTVKPGIMSSLTRILRRVTTQTEGWYLSFVEEDTQAPNPEYLNLFLEKAWKNRDKGKKLYDIIDKHTEYPEVIQNSAIALKILNFLHLALVEGPPEMASIPLDNKNKRNKKGGATYIACSFIHYLILKIKVEWETIAREGTKDKKDKLRTQAMSWMIYFYSMILAEKAKFSLDYIDVFGGNFSVEPLRASQEVKAIFSYKTYVDLHSYCSMYLRFLKLLVEEICPQPLQFCIIKIVASEIYNSLSVLCHFAACYKKTVFSLEMENEDVIEKIIERLDSCIDNCIFRFHYILEEVKQSKSFKIFADLLPNSSVVAVNELKAIQTMQSQPDKFNLDTVFPPNAYIGVFQIPSAFGPALNKKEKSNQEKLLMIKRELSKDVKYQLSKSQVTETNSLSPGQRTRAANSPTEHQGRKATPREKSDMSIYEKFALNPKYVDSNHDNKNPYQSFDDDGEGIMVEQKNSKRSIKLVKSRPQSPLPLADRDVDIGLAKEYEGKNYNPLDESFASLNHDVVRSPLLGSNPEFPSFKRIKESNKEFLSICKKQDVGVQCDLIDMPLVPPNIDLPFDLYQFMKEEISNGRLYSY